MMTKLRMMQTNKEKAMKIDAMIKSLHAYKHAGDRAGRGARLHGHHMGRSLAPTCGGSSAGCSRRGENCVSTRIYVPRRVRRERGRNDARRREATQQYSFGVGERSVATF